MLFCNKCGNLMVSENKKGKLIYVCRNCGFTNKSIKANVTTISEKIKNKDTIVVIEKDENFEEYPIDKDVKCPECGKKGAYWFMKQTRAADEAPTIFYCCTNCKHKWREY